MTALFILIVWIIFLVNFFALLGTIGIAKFLIDTKIIWLRALVSPESTASSVRKQAGSAIKYAAWTIGSALVLFLIYM